MYKKLKHYLILVTLLISSPKSFAMKQSPDDNVPASYQRIQTAIKTEPWKIPEEIKNNPARWREYINYVCQDYSNKIDKLDRQAFEIFGQHCGLTPPSWDYFIQRVQDIWVHTNSFTLRPVESPQYISPHIAKNDIANLRNICLENQICFEKIDILETTPEESSLKPPFLIHTPLYTLSQLDMSTFIFSPDTLTLNKKQYEKNSDFFNICIVGALKQQVARVIIFFNSVFNEQQLQSFSVFNLTAAQEQSQLFVKNYGFKIGILRLILKTTGVARIIKDYLDTNPVNCSNYGFTQKNYVFLQHMIAIDELKKLLLVSENDIDLFSDDMTSNHFYIDIGF